MKSLEELKQELQKLKQLEKLTQEQSQKYFSLHSQIKEKELGEKIKKIDPNSIRELSWYWKENINYPDKFTFEKTKLMDQYEQETGKRAVFKVIKPATAYRYQVNTYKGLVQVTKGYLEWEKENQ